jgi:hypothetical protein
MEPFWYLTASYQASEADATTNRTQQTGSGSQTSVTISIPASGALSKPVQRVMPVNEFVITVVLQKIHAVLDNDGGNQAIH